MTWIEGTGESAKVVRGTSTGATRVIGTYPTFTGAEKSIIYNPKNNKYYFVRDTELIEYDPATEDTRSITSDPVSAVAVDPKGNIVYATESEVVSQDPSSSDVDVIMTLTEPIESLDLDFDRSGPKPMEEDEDVTPEPVIEGTETAPSDNVYVYYISGNTVIKENKNDPTAEKETIKVPGATNYVVDPTKNALYFVMFGQNIIREQPIGGDRVFIIRKAGKVSSMKIDTKRQILYYTDSVKGELQSYNLQTGARNMIYSGLREPEKMSVVLSTG